MIAKLREKLLNPEIALKKPFIVGGLGLTLGIALWHTVVPSFSDMLGMATWSAIALGAGTWWLSKRDGKPLDLSPIMPSTINRETVEATLADLKAYLQQFTTAVTETAVNPTQYQRGIAQLQQRHGHLLANLDRTQLQCSVVGMKGVGKTSVIEQLNALGIGSSVDAASLVFLESNVLGQTAEQQDPQTAVKNGVGDTDSQKMAQHLCQSSVNADLIVFVSEGDLTSTELTHIQSLLKHGHTVVMVFNKQDRYLPTERLDILNRIGERLIDQIDPDGIVPTSAITTRIKVRQHQPDGSMVERFDEVPADVTALVTQLQSLLTDQADVLVWKTTLRQAHQLRSDVRDQWNRVKRDRALPVIEKYQWLAAAAAFANPVPSLDLVATGAINAQLLADLGAMYDQPLALDQAKIATRTLAELMVKLGLVELATQAIAPLLKTHVLTFAAGGAAQGLSAAYLTHVAGLSLIQYFEEQTALGVANAEGGWNLDRLGQIMQQVVQTCQRGQFVQNLVEQGISKLSQQVQAKPTATAVS